MNIAFETELRTKYGMPRQTLSDLKKNSDEIEQFTSQMTSVDMGKKKRKQYVNCPMSNWMMLYMFGLCRNVAKEYRCLAPSFVKKHCFSIAN